MSELEWIPCEDDYRIGDVVRWREPAWKPRARKGTPPIGERLITAQVTRCDTEWVEFALKSCVTTNAEGWWRPIPELKADKPLKKRRGPLGKKKPERKPWGGKDGEAARAEVVRSS